MTAALLWPAVVCLAGAMFFADSAIDDARHGFFVPATRAGGIALLCLIGAGLALWGAVS